MSTSQQDQQNTSQRPADHKDGGFQDPGMTGEKPTAEHKWLQKLVGEWTSEMDSMTPDGPNQKSVGTDSVRSLGDLWVVAEGRGEMSGGAPAVMMMTLGYDPKKRRYVGTWVGSMMSRLWVYDGALNAGGRVLTLDSEGPSMTGRGGLVKYRDAMEFKNDNHRVLTSSMMGDDGQWHEFMTVNYKRNH